MIRLTYLKLLAYYYLKRSDQMIEPLPLKYYDYPDKNSGLTAETKIPDDLAHPDKYQTMKTYAANSIDTIWRRDDYLDDPISYNLPSFGRDLAYDIPNDETYPYFYDYIDDTKLHNQFTRVLINPEKHYHFTFDLNSNINQYNGNEQYRPENTIYVRPILKIIDHYFYRRDHDREVIDVTDIALQNHNLVMQYDTKKPDANTAYGDTKLSYTLSQILCIKQPFDWKLLHQIYDQQHQPDALIDPEFNIPEPTCITTDDTSVKTKIPNLKPINTNDVVQKLAYLTTV